VSPAAATVLLVEDSPDLGPLLRDTIEEWNWRVVLARNGSEAMELLAREAVALVLLDHELPDMSGPEVLARLRSEQRRIPPVVLMTARLRPGANADLPEVVEVLRKPFELSQLSELLERRLPRR